jgi:peptidoglycan hydrolase-like protein with peptidoglycan-binding domain
MYLTVEYKFPYCPANQNKNKKYMSNFKVLVRVSLALLIVNFVLAGIVAFNHFRTEDQKKALASQSFQNEEVLGSSVPIFAPDKVISDEDFNSTRACPTAQAVQEILNRFNSPLKNYSVDGRSAASIIFSAARGETSTKYGLRPQFNPCLLLAFLEKEQSLVTTTPSPASLEGVLGTAMGYGCPDYAGCDPAYKGFVNQVNWGAYQLQYNYNLANNNQLTDAYQVGRTIYTLDGFNVFIRNAGTASAYRYTPSVYWGNYNLWKLMTANGWGASGSTYSLAEIDAVNIPNKANILNEQAKNSIKESDVADILNNPPAMGTQNDKVKLLQEFLRQQGYFTYPIVTGYYGTVTDAARVNYLADAANRTQRTNTCDPLYAKTWKTGQSGDDVKKLQECLKAENLFAWPTITGVFGSVTEQGLNTIRTRKNITVGTISTPQTPTTPAVATKKYRTTPKDSGTALNFRASPCGGIIGTIGWNVDIDADPTSTRQACFGGTWDWYKVNFGGKTGWVAGFYLTEVLQNTNPITTTQPVTSTTTKFKTNSRGTSAQALNIRDNPCGTQVAQTGWQTEGTRLEGPLNKTCFGGTWDWYKVNFGGKTGWVAGFYLDVISGQSNSGKKFVTNSRGDSTASLNVRNKPCGEKIGDVAWGVQIIQGSEPITAATCFGANINWYKVELPSGTNGWVAGNYLQGV